MGKCLGGGKMSNIQHRERRCRRHPYEFQRPPPPLLLLLLLPLPASPVRQTTSDDDVVGKLPLLPYLLGAFSALTLLVERQEGHPVCKN